MTVADAEAPARPRIGIVLRDALAWRELVQVVATAEDSGYEAVFVPEIDGREAFSTLTGLVGATERLKVGTGVVTVWTRHPATAAMAAGTVNELSDGRMILGVGAGSPTGPGATVAGGNSTPLRLVEEYVRVLREVASGEPVSPGPIGDPFRAAGFRSSLRGPAPPIWLAALGDRMLTLAGRVADGVLLNWCPPERVRSARRVLGAAAREAGRDPASVTVAVYVRACLGVEDEVALPPLMAMTGLYASIPHYLKQLEAVGLGADGVAAAAAFAAGRPQEVPERLTRMLTVIGGRDEALARFEAYREAGADLVLCYPVTARDPFSSVLGTVLAAAPSPPVER